ncbi:hypothetical protein [Ferirhizobium litorale]|uniref:Uncharacterized protein n=1 Tax=Ferirhizobium litorale TaxID=2927786 RepID=A0AAE3QJM0_9HYPH|nr:hypothetical protein [Fererhizobium litorale]MDI7924561.1 hypothetical protein [Fererhizobium litorale]
MRATATDTRSQPRRGAVLPTALAPFGVTREQAAALLSISPSLFDNAVEAGTMPQPRILRGRNIWDVNELYECFLALPSRRSANDQDLDAAPSQGNAFDDAKKAQ